VEEIIQKRILTDSHLNWHPLKGGTDSTVGALGTPSVPNMYVVKSNTNERIAAEFQFYRLYHALPLLPKVKYVDPEFRFLIYPFIPGETRYSRGTKQKLMSELVNHMIQHYVQPERPDDYEWVEDPRRTQQDIDYAQSVIVSHITEEDHDLVKEIYMRKSKRVLKKRLYVLHGDFGVHNFLFANGRLSGIIDPIPVIGRPLYDLLYAFCSSPDDLHLPILLDAAEQISMEKIHTPDLIEDMVLALYFRICSCILHHPEDLPEYRRAWNEWMQNFD
jgi:hypothetical protein